jgi:hypothetical protein
MERRAGVPKSSCLALIRIMANCFQWLKGIATIVLMGVELGKRLPRVYYGIYFQGCLSGWSAFVRWIARCEPIKDAIRLIR